MKEKITNEIDELDTNDKENEEKSNDRNKFKKVEMPMFNGAR